MAACSDFSSTALWARIGGAADSTLAASGLAPRGVVVELPDDERDALVSRASPFIAGREDLRLQTYAAVDKRARLLVPLAGGTAFIGLLLAGQGLVVALIFGLLGAMAGWFLAMGKRSRDYQNAVKSRIAAATTESSSGHEHAVEPETDLAFHVPPYWVPLDAGALVTQFASDLAIRNRLVDAVLALPDGSEIF